MTLFLIQVVTTLMRNDWPIRWPDVFTELRSLTLTGDTQCEMALLVIRALPEEIFKEGISVVRRNELLQALHLEMPSLLSYLSQMLEQVCFGPVRDTYTQKHMRVLLRVQARTHARNILRQMPSSISLLTAHARKHACHL